MPETFPQVSQSHIMRPNDFSFLFSYYFCFPYKKKEKETYTCSIKRAVKLHVVFMEGVVRDWLKKERVGVETLKEKEPLGSYL
jgi:hypothetical protein